MLEIVTVVRDYGLYNRWIRDNPHCRGSRLVVFDNRKTNLPIPVHYNAYLNCYDHSRPAWILFCHEDFELRENLIERVEFFPKDCLNGFVGSVRKGAFGFGMQYILGNMMDAQKDGCGGEWRVARRIHGPVEVETFDCCALLVHSSLVAKFDLRFDERLEFDLYVEDFCATAKVKHAIRSLVQPVECCHHSGSHATARLYRHLPYLKSKYPHNCFVGPLVYFGTPNWQKRLQDKIVNKARKIFSK